MDKIFLNREEICQAVGINKNDLPRYVKDHGLPAFKNGAANGKASWKARRVSLERWAEQFEQELLSRH